MGAASSSSLWHCGGVTGTVLSPGGAASEPPLSRAELSTRVFTSQSSAIAALRLHCEAGGHVCARVVPVGGSPGDDRHVIFVGTDASATCACLAAAISAGDIDTIRSLLIQRGVSISKPSAAPLKLTPLHLAAASGKVAALDALLTMAALSGREADLLSARWGCPTQYERGVGSHLVAVRHPASMLDPGLILPVAPHAKAMKVLPELAARGAAATAERTAVLVGGAWARGSVSGGIRLYSLLDAALLSGSASVIRRTVAALAEAGVLTPR